MDMKFARKNMRWILLAGLAQLALACIIFPPKIHYNSYLVPADSKEVDAAYENGSDGSISYTIEGLRINVKFMTDAELNELLPEDSQRGEYSTNPYTYGNQINRDVGHVSNRFTVFRVSISNQTYAKVQQDPVAPVLQTDRGQILYSYGIPSTSPYNSFERYYRGLRGQSGNEFYRFEVRMGHVRSLNYAEDQPIFKGESYSGLIAFDPLSPEVEKVRLELRDFALKFDEYGTPLETIDLKFDFKRKIEKWKEGQAGSQVSFEALRR